MSNQHSDELFRKLAAEEPPLQPEDTQSRPTAPTQPFVVDGGGQRLMAASLLMVALFLTIAATLLIYPGDDNSDDGNSDVVVDGVETRPDATASASTVPATPVPTVVSNTIVDDGPVSLPTAAIDEAFVALLTPVAASSNLNPVVIQRDNQPFTRRTGESESTANTTLANYTVQTGDTLDEIKNRFGLEDICSIIWSNDRRKVSPLRPGVTLTIPPVDGYYALIRQPISIAELAESSGVDAQGLIDSAFNPLLAGATPQNLLPEGAGIMVPGGDGGNCNIWAAERPADENVPSGPGANILDYVRFYGLLGCNIDSITPGSFPANTPYVGNFWQGFSAGHTGVDLSGNTGDPIRAAGGGTVIFAGVNNFGYGNTVAIAHGTNFTIYAHLNSISVTCGQQVSALQVIGTLGSSGNSTGPHLHFEIRNGAFEPLDPCFTISC